MGGVGSGRLRIGQPPLTREAKRKRNRDRSTKWRAANKDLVKAKIKQWRKENPESYHQINRNNYLKNKVKQLKKHLYDLQYERNNKDKRKKWYQENRERRIAYAKEQRMKKLA